MGDTFSDAVSEIDDELERDRDWYESQPVITAEVLRVRGEMERLRQRLDGGRESDWADLDEAAARASALV